MTTKIWLVSRSIYISDQYQNQCEFTWVENWRINTLDCASQARGAFSITLVGFNSSTHGRFCLCSISLLALHQIFFDAMGSRPAPRVAVIGLGACGLVTLKNLLEAGFDATGFDRNDYIGGLWKFSFDSNKTTVLPTTYANGSKQLVCYTDFPFPGHVRNHPSAAQFAQYFEDYANAFGLLSHARLGVVVEKIARSPGDDGWQVVSRCSDEAKEEQFDKVILCHGYMVNEPNVPKIIGTFDGLAMHSNQFKGPKPFEGKSVVVVGMGHTGPDIACSLVGFAGKVYLSHRRGHAIVSPLARFLLEMEKTTDRSG